MNTLTFEQDRKSASGEYCSLVRRLGLELHAIERNWEEGKPPVVTERGGRPGWEVYGAGPFGIFKAGAAWMRVTKRGDQPGTEFFTMTLDGEGFDDPLNLVAFQTGNPGEYELKWERPRRADNAA